MNLKGFLENRFNRDAVWLTGSFAVLAVCGVILNVVIIDRLGNEALGVFNLVYALYVILSQVAAGGLNFSALAYISRNRDHPEVCASITTSALLVGVLLGIPVCVIAFLLRNVVGNLMGSQEVAAGLTLAIPGIFFFVLNRILLYVLNGWRSMRAFSIYNALRFVLIIVFVLLLLRLGYTGTAMPAALTLTEIALLALLLVDVNLRLFPLWRVREMGYWSRKHFSFGVRSAVSGVLFQINTRINVLVLGYFLTEDRVGLYSFAAFLAEGILQLVLVFRRNIDPILGECFAQNDFERLLRVASRVKRTFYPMMAAVAVLAGCAFPLLFQNRFPSPDDMRASWAVFGILMVGVVLSSGYRPLLGILLQGERPGLHSIFALSVVGVNFVANVILTAAFGIFGAAAATAAIFVFEVTMLRFWSKRAFGLRI
ncbi:MAG: oligosaccharide flippase family protein [Clostridiales bacterium]|nr:oligosaccharide flippase family protein [Clostridiales bacterium]